jgi:hypothetical protein
MQHGVWYRHWLELRELLAITFVITVVIGAYVASKQSSPSVVGPVLFRSLPPGWDHADLERMSTLYTHAVAAMSILGSTVLLAGAGTRSFDWRMRPVTASTYYTLSLPVSRLRLVATRVAVTCAAIVAQSVLVLLISIAGVLIRGRSASLADLAAISGFAALLVLALMMLLAVAMSWSDKFMQAEFTIKTVLIAQVLLAAMIGLMLLVLFSAWPQFLRFVGADGAIPWLTLVVPVAIPVAIGGVAFALTVYGAYRRDH